MMSTPCGNVPISYYKLSRRVEFSLDWVSQLSRYAAEVVAGSGDGWWAGAAGQGDAATDPAM